MVVGLEGAIATKSILFIDPTVEDYQSLICGTDPNIKIVILDAYRDGIEQISESLTRNKGLKAVHILSHGSPGRLYLGNSQLSRETVERYTSQLQQWGEALGENADILIYGCKVGADLTFVRQLRELTGANIAASATPTGNTALGGDWNLEVTVGEVSSSAVFADEVRQTYAGVLAEINVTVASDTVDGDTSSISALQLNTGTDGEISLREAIIAANNTAGDDAINLTGGETYTLTVAGGEEDDSATGDLDIKNNGTIIVQSAGSAKATIDAGGSGGLGDRVFDVREDASLKLENVVVTGGVVPASEPYHDDNGGGIRVNEDGNLELTDSSVVGNYASSHGGGISNYLGTIIVTNSQISENIAQQAGGGIENVEGTISITNTTINDNSAGGSGGGILNFGIERDYGEVNVSNSIISGNSAANLGGGIATAGGRLNVNDTSISDNSATEGGGINSSSITTISDSAIASNSATKGGGIGFNWGGSASISNSTVSSNSATDGGGIWNYRSTVEISSSTISENTATSEGGGLLNQSYYDPNSGNTDDANATIANSIIAGNSNDDDVSGDGIFTSNGYNLIGNDTTWVFNQTGDQRGHSGSPLDAKLGPLQDNGAATQTHALLADSPAIDSGNSSEPNDQRGAARDYSPDIGAFEFGSPPPFVGDRLFGVKIEDDGSNRIVVLNPLTGSEIHSFSAPAGLFTGLAFDGNSLFFAGSNTLWELDPDTGVVRDSDVIAAEFSGVAALNEKIYLFNKSGNYDDGNFVEFDPVKDIVTNALDYQSGGVYDYVGLAGITEPNALLVSLSDSQVLEMNPFTGAVTDSFSISNLTEGIAVIDKEIYVSKLDGSPGIEVYDRSGALQRTIELPYAVTGLGSDDIAKIEFEESNDTRSQATDTGLNAENYGVFRYFGDIGDNSSLTFPDLDVDLYKFDLGPGGRVRISQDPELLDTKGNTVGYAEVQLFDATGTSPLALSPDPANNSGIYDSEQGGTFYVGISNDGNNSYNPDVEESGSQNGYQLGRYGLTIETIGSEEERSDRARLFAVKDDDSHRIVELNPSTGEEINVFLAPETLFSRRHQGLAFDGSSLFFISGTQLWELDPNTGAVRDSDAIDNAGLFDGIAALNGKIYLFNYSSVDNSRITEFDPVSDTITKTLNVEGTNGASLEGGFAAITGPNALLASGSNGKLFEINPATGEVTNSYFILGGLTEGIAVIDKEIYVSHDSSDGEIEVYNRSGEFQRGIDLPYSVTGLGGDDLGWIELQEPNDTLTDAVNTGFTLDNSGSYSYTGEVGDNNNILQALDVDLFELELDIGDTVRFNLPQRRDESDSFIANTKVRLFDASGTALDWIEDGTDYGRFTAENAGTFYLGVSDFENDTYDANDEGSGAIGDNYSEGGTYELTIEKIREENVTLNPGDIAFVQYNADGTDNFKFVALVDIPGSEEINFTDNGWKSGNTFRTGEGIITWTAPGGGISAGTVVEIDTTPSASVGTVSEQSDLNFSGSGDQILAYQGTDSFIAALNNEGTAIWQADAADTNTSVLPSGLTDGTNAVAINEIDNAIYTGATTGDKATLLAALNDSANWTGDDSTNQTFNDTFTLSSSSQNTMTTTIFYDNTAFTPDDNAAAANGPWLSFNDITTDLGNTGTATQSADGAKTTLDTTGTGGTNNDIYAGYSNFNTSSSLVNPSFPELDNTKGYTLSFTLQVVSEAKTAADIDYNDDGLDDRAGFSVIAVSEDTSKSIEISFETDEIWAQDITGTSSTSLVRGEGATFDTTTGLIEYDLKVLADDTYELYANDLLTLSGSLRDYTPINDLAVDPYETSSSIFLGDRTDDARAEVNISAVSVATADADKPTHFDFNDDGVADILWHNDTTGGNQIWLMNGDGTRNDVAYPGQRNTTWQIEGVADFTNDGVADILWRNPNTGRIQTWLMNGDGTRNTTAYPGLRNNDWQVAGVADFTNDGVADIYWRNPTTGGNQIWLMNGDGTRNDVAYPGLRGGDWQVAGVADFTNDGVADIYWRNETTGGNQIWLMNPDGTRDDVAYPGLRGGDWQVAGVADFTNDGVADIYWRNPATGGNQIWLMNGDGTLNNVGYPGQRSTNWEPMMNDVNSLV